MDVLATGTRDLLLEAADARAGHHAGRELRIAGAARVASLVVGAVRLGGSGSGRGEQKPNPGKAPVRPGDGAGPPRSALGRRAQGRRASGRRAREMARSRVRAKIRF